MQTKYQRVLIHICIKGEVETGLSPPVKYFTDRSKQAGLNLTLSETPKTGFLASRPNYRPVVLALLSVYL